MILYSTIRGSIGKREAPAVIAPANLIGGCDPSAGGVGSDGSDFREFRRLLSQEAYQQPLRNWLGRTVTEERSVSKPPGPGVLRRPARRGVGPAGFHPSGSWLQPPCQRNVSAGALTVNDPQGVE